MGHIGFRLKHLKLLEVLESYLEHTGQMNRLIIVSNVCTFPADDVLSVETQINANTLVLFYMSLLTVMANTSMCI